MTNEENGRLHEMSAEIGGLKASLELLTKIWQQQDSAAAAGRRALYEKFELVRQESGIQIAGLGIRVDRLSDQVKLVEPSIQAFKDEKLRKEGAERLGVRLYTAMIAAAGLVGWGLHEFGDKISAWLKSF